MRSKTYTTNVLLKRQQADAPNPAKFRNLAPKTDLAEVLANFLSGPVAALAAQLSDGQHGAVYRSESKVQGSARRRNLWVDPASGRPVRASVTYRNGNPGGGASDWISTDFVFDAELPRSLFSTDPPAGFKLKNSSGKAGEKGTSAAPLP